MLTIERTNADRLVEQKILTSDELEKCQILLSSVLPTIREIDRAAVMYKETGSYPPGYAQKGLPEVLENYIDEIIALAAVPETFYVFLREVMTTDTTELNTLVYRRTRE